jgi:hypothetical protein
MGNEREARESDVILFFVLFSFPFSLNVNVCEFLLTSITLAVQSFLYFEAQWILLEVVRFVGM